MVITCARARVPLVIHFQLSRFTFSVGSNSARVPDSFSAEQTCAAAS